MSQAYNMDASDKEPLVMRVLKSRTKLEWSLIIVAIVLAIIAIVFIAGYSYCRDNNKADDRVEVAINPGHCTNLDGVWYNNLGSQAIFNHTSSGFLFGEYRTAVERYEGASGGSHSIIVGAAPYTNPGSVFAFSVMWSDGASMTTWTGQCVSCNGTEMLITSWMLRSKVSSCENKWMSTRVGQDVFTRYDQVDGPRRNETDYVPSQTLLDVLKWTPSADLDNIKAGEKCSLDGAWRAENDEATMILAHEQQIIIEGRYQTNNIFLYPWMKEYGDHSAVYGIANSKDYNSTVALFVVYGKGESVTGWTGQCHVCGEEELLETTWLHRNQVATCKENWKSTLYGQTTFKRKN